MELTIPNPALKDLEPLVGEWALEITFPDDPPNEVFGTATFNWFDGGAFLLMRSTVDWEGPSRSTAVIGRDDGDELYSLLYFDDRGVSRIYKMTFREGVWHQWRTAPEFSQRFTGTLGFTGDVITARWETSNDGSVWEHDFDLTYRRL